MLIMDEESDGAIQQPEAVTRYICRHIFTDGRRCGSVCLRHEEFCYYHHTARRPVANPRGRKRRSATFDLPLIEDRSSVQSSIAEVLRRIASNNIDPRRAGLLLYGLQIAAANMPRLVARRNAEADNPASQLVEEVVLDSANGPLAPPAVYYTEDEIRDQKSIGRQVLNEIYELERNNDKEWYESLVEAAESRTEEANRRAAEATSEAEEWKRSCQLSNEAMGGYHDRCNAALDVLRIVSPDHSVLHPQKDAPVISQIQAVAASKVLRRCRKSRIVSAGSTSPRLMKTNAGVSPLPLVGRDDGSVDGGRGHYRCGIPPYSRIRELRSKALRGET